MRFKKVGGQVGFLTGLKARRDRGLNHSVERRERETKEIEPGNRWRGGGAGKSMAFRFLVCGVGNGGTAVENEGRPPLG